MLRLFLPQICVHCGAHCDDSAAKRMPLAKYLCTVCIRQFKFFEPPMPEDFFPKSSLFHELPFEIRVGSGFTFQPGGIIQSVIHHFKYAEMPKLATILGEECSKRNADLSG